MYHYAETRRPTLVLTWADGTVRIDDPRDQDVNPLGEYLNHYHTSKVEPGDVPTAVYAWCDFCGKMHECKVEKVNQTIDDEWIWTHYQVEAIVPDTDFTKKITYLTVRTDGRA